MSEFELAYMVNETFDTMYVVFQFWFYMTFGILTASFVAAGRLPRSMLHLVTILYVLVTFACVFELMIFGNDLISLGTRLAALRSDGAIPSSGWAGDGLATLFSHLDNAFSSLAILLGTLGTVYHLYFTARKGAPEPT